MLRCETPRIGWRGLIALLGDFAEAPAGGCLGKA